MISVLLALSLFAAGSEPGTEAAAAPAPAAAEAGEDEAKRGNSDERFCRKEKPMGSKIPKVRCYVKQEFERRQAEEREHTRKIQMDAQAPRSN